MAKERTKLGKVFNGTNVSQVPVEQVLLKDTNDVVYKVTVTTDGTLSVTPMSSASVPVTGITINQSDFTITDDITKQLTATITPANATNQIITWTSSDSNIATISSTGLLTAVNPGTCIITATCGTKSDTVNATVQASMIPVTLISINESSNTITNGDTTQLSATISPSNATVQTITWSSSDETVATVSNTGLVTSKKAGSCVITATCGTKTDTITITVIDEDNDISVNSISINEVDCCINTTGTKQLSTTVSPSNATNQTVTWASSDETVATVNSTGLVSAVKNGACIITATCGTQSDTFKLAVTTSGEYDPITAITVSPITKKYYIGDTQQMTAQVTPPTANPNVTWSTDNTGVSTIDENGMIRFTDAGSSNIKATSVADTSIYGISLSTVLRDYGKEYISTRNSINFIPDEFNTGCDETIPLTKVKPGDTIDGLRFTVSSNPRELLVNRYNNPAFKNNATIENYDFSDYDYGGFLNYNGSEFEEERIVTFNNCCFSNFRGMRTTKQSKLKFILNHCTIRGVSYGYYELNWCKIGSISGDGLNPLNETIHRNCYIRDIMNTVIKQGAVMHADGYKFMDIKTSMLSIVYLKTVVSNVLKSFTKIKLRDVI